MTSQHYSFPSRVIVSVATLGIVLLLVIADLNASGGIDPFDTPAPVALGSGEAASGAHCTGT